MEVELNYSGVDQRRSMKKREKRGKAREKKGPLVITKRGQRKKKLNK